MKLTKEQEKGLREYPPFTCGECNAALSKGYCGQCDEYYNYGHEAGCSRISERDDHSNHRSLY